MKKVILIIIAAVLVGGIFSLYMFNDLEKTVALVVSPENEVTLFQVGVFQKKANASGYQKKYPNSILYQDGNYYRVIIAAYDDVDCLQRMELYFKNTQIVYYLKKIKVDEEFIKTLHKYEELFSQSNDEVISTVNKEILKELAKYI